MKVFHVSWNALETVFHEMLWKKSFTVYPCLKCCFNISSHYYIQKQLSRTVLKKRCSENMQHIYRRTPMLECDFNKVTWNFMKITLRHGCSLVNLLHIFRTPFLKGTLMQISLNVCIHIKTIPWKFCNLNPKNSRVICPWSL